MRVSIDVQCQYDVQYQYINKTRKTHYKRLIILVICGILKLMPFQIRFLKKITYRFETGFTLVELLVVISIIVMMSGIALTLYQSAQSRSRDSQRMADLKAVQSALEQYRFDLNSYPPQTVLNYSPNAFDSGASLTGKGNIYIGILPRDPLFGQSGSLNYVYYALPNSVVTICDGVNVLCTNYCLGAKLENNPAIVDNNCSAYIKIIDPGYNYYISKSSNF